MEEVKQEEIFMPEEITEGEAVEAVEQTVEEGANDGVQTD